MLPHLTNTEDVRMSMAHHTYNAKRHGHHTYASQIWCPVLVSGLKNASVILWTVWSQPVMYIMHGICMLPFLSDTYALGSFGTRYTSETSSQPLEGLKTRLKARGKGKSTRHQLSSVSFVDFREGCRTYLVWSTSVDWSRTGSLAGRGLGVRARGPVDPELTDPSGVRARGLQGSMKACDPMGVTSVEPGWKQAVMHQ